MTINQYFQTKSALLEKTLDSFLPKETEEPKLLHEAMRYAVLGGGKRIRPILTLAVSEMLKGKESQALIPACAIELIHSYSLVHDDLPLMDNDDMRRGRPSCHKQYGDALALLVGDGLLTLSFEILSNVEDSVKSSRLTREIARAAGTKGMVGGQVLDIQFAPQKSDVETLNDINQLKTGKLIQVSALAGAVIAGASRQDEQHILRYGQYLGFAFQIVDDIMDADGLLSFLSPGEAKKQAQELIEKAKRELTKFKGESGTLCLIADSILERAKQSVN